MNDAERIPTNESNDSPEKEVQVEGVTRREFCANMLVGATFVGTAAGILNATVRYLIPPKQAIGGTAEKMEVALLAELLPGTSKYFGYNGIPCAVINDDGEIKAFSRICTHLDCAIDWVEDNSTFFCPCHAAVFDSNGNVVSGPAPAPLPELEVTMENDRIFVGGWKS